MDTYTACEIIEGFDGKEHSDDEVIAATQYLIDNGEAWKLQGFYGRLAASLINCGVCHARNQS